MDGCCYGGPAIKRYIYADFDGQSHDVTHQDALEGRWHDIYRLKCAGDQAAGMCVALKPKLRHDTSMLTFSKFALCENLGSCLIIQHL